MIKLTVIIPNYNGVDFLQGCLDSLLHQHPYLEVVLVDNGSHDGSVEYIKKNYNQLKMSYQNFILIENQENLGFSQAVNQGINQSSADYVFLLNNDAELEQGCISHLLECAEKDEDIFAVATKMVQYQDRDKLDDAGRITYWAAEAGKSDLYNYPENCVPAGTHRKDPEDRYLDGLCLLRM